MNIRMVILWMCLLLAGNVSPVNASERVDADLLSYDQTVARMKAEFQKTPVNPANVGWVKLKLAHMYEVDQFTRGFGDVVQKNKYTKAEADYFWSKFMDRFHAVDRENTGELKGLLKIHSWIRISVFGDVADNQAWLIVQHADLDPTFQAEVLKLLGQLYPQGETKPGNYAYLFDRVAASWSDTSRRKLQRYGTQGDCKGIGLWEPIPMEKPEELEARRAAVGLSTMAEYLKVVGGICK